MSQKRKPKSKRKLAAPASRETPGAEALTVAWSLLVLTGFACDLAAAITRLLVQPE